MHLMHKALKYLLQKDHLFQGRLKPEISVIATNAKMNRRVLFGRTLKKHLKRKQNGNLNRGQIKAFIFEQAGLVTIEAAGSKIVPNCVALLKCS
jgi:hypothetical protein